MKVRVDLRDELNEIGRRDLGGATLNSALEEVLRAYRLQRVLEQHERLRADPDELASYRGESREWEKVGWTDSAGGTSER